MGAVSESAANKEKRLPRTSRNGHAQPAEVGFPHRVQVYVQMYITICIYI